MALFQSSASKASMSPENFCRFPFSETKRRYRPGARQMNTAWRKRKAAARFFHIIVYALQELLETMGCVNASKFPVTAAKFIVSRVESSFLGRRVWTHVCAVRSRNFQIWLRF